MDKNFFENAQKLIHEHDELMQILNDLQNDNTNLGAIFNDCDGPGVNYKMYSKDIKNLIMDAVKNRLTEIEKNFN